jgi:hypothetical protein
MSLGSRSGVNWINFKSHLMDCAIVFDISVLPTPGEALKEHLLSGEQSEEGLFYGHVSRHNNIRDVYCEGIDIYREPILLCLGHAYTGHFDDAGGRGA